MNAPSKPTLTATAATCTARALKSCLHVAEVPVEYADDAPEVDGRIIIRDNFKALFEREPLLLTFGEDTTGASAT